MKASGIPYEMHPSSIEGIPSIYNSDAILSNQSFYVLLPQLEEAEKVVAKFRKEEAKAAKERQRLRGNPRSRRRKCPGVSAFLCRSPRLSPLFCWCGPL